MRKENISEDEKYLRKIQLTIGVFIIITILVFAAGTYGLFQYFESSSKEVNDITLEEKTISEQDYGYNFTAPLVKPVTTYIVGKDLDPGIYDVNYSESGQGNGNMTVDKFLEIDNCEVNCESIRIYINSKGINDSIVYDNLNLVEGDQLTINLDGSGQYNLIREDDFSLLSEQKDGVSATLQPQAGTYKLKVSDVDELSEPEDLYIESYEGDDVHRYYVEEDDGNYYFVHDLVSADNEEITVIYRTEFVQDLNAEIILFEKNYVYFNYDEMNGKYELIPTF